MKYFFIFFLTLPLFSVAQDCKIKSQVDPYTKETRITTGFVTLGAGMNQVSLSIDATKTDIEFIFSVNRGKEGKCFDHTSAALFMYEGGRLKGNFKNSSSMNCEGLFTISFRNVTTTPSNLKNLAGKKTMSIKLTGNGKEVTEIALTEGEQEMLMNLASCIIAESKNLIKKT